MALFGWAIVGALIVVGAASWEVLGAALAVVLLWCAWNWLKIWAVRKQHEQH